MSNLWTSFHPTQFADPSNDQNQWNQLSTPVQPVHPVDLGSTSSTNPASDISGYLHDESPGYRDTTGTAAASGRPPLETDDDPNNQGSDSFSSKDSDQHGASGHGKQGSSTDLSAKGDASGSLRRGMACTFCRKRKLRCSGEKPRCTSCVKYNKECEYGQGTKGAKFQQLENRIAELSEYIKSANPTPPLPPPHQQPSMLPDHTPSPSLPYTYQQPNSYASVPVFTEAYNPSFHTADAYLDFSNTFSTPEIGPDTSNSFSSGFAPFGHTPQMGYVPEWSNTLPNPGVGPGDLSVFPPYVTPNETTSCFPFDNSVSTSHAGPSLTQPARIHPTPNLPHVPSLSSSLYDQSSTEPTVGQQNYLHHVRSAGEPINGRQDIRSSHEKIMGDYNKWQATRQSSQSNSSPSGASTPDTMNQPPLSTTVNPKSPNNFGRPLPNPGMLNSIATPRPGWGTRIDPVEGITESLGEFLFNPTAVPATTTRLGEETSTKRRKGTGEGGAPRARSKSLIKMESDGLTESAREILLDCFLAHSRLFFEMSIPRFRYRMTFTDRRRPAPALLYAMYLWATRMSNSPKASPMETHFFEAGLKALDVSSANGDRLIDCMRAAMLLSAYSYTSGRYHEGWILAGLAVRLIISTGLHHIKSCVFTLEPPRSPFLRNKAYLLPPPEDATELAERIATFWCIVAIDRCSALATGFPAGIRDSDVTTPFPRPLADVISGLVSPKDDITIKDLYRPSGHSGSADTSFTLWMKSTLILEKASKLAFMEPDPQSEFARGQSIYADHAPSNPSFQPPPAMLDQPQYRVPKIYNETKLAMEQLIVHMGEDGIFPVDRRRAAEAEGKEPPHITSHTIMIHHQLSAIHMLLHDINSLEADNTEAIRGAKKAVALIRRLPPLPYHDVDTFCVTIWSIITKGLIKELRRQYVNGDAAGVTQAEDDVDLFIEEMQRVGVVMQLARSQAVAMLELKKQALKSVSQEPSPSVDRFAEYPHLQPTVGRASVDNEIRLW